MKLGNKQRSIKASLIATPLIETPSAYICGRCIELLVTFIREHWPKYFNANIRPLLEPEVSAKAGASAQKRPKDRQDAKVLDEGRTTKSSSA